MINKPNIETLRAIARLTYNEDFKTMTKWLESELVNISEANNEQLDIVLTRRGQGAASLLRQLLSIQSEAESILKKIKR